MRKAIFSLAMTAAAFTTASIAGTAHAGTQVGADLGGTVQTTNTEAVVASDGCTTTFAKKAKAAPVSPSTAYLNTQSKHAVRYVHCVV